MNERVLAEVRALHDRRDEAWRRRDGEGYLSFYADDAQFFASEARFGIAELREWVTKLMAAGGGAVNVDLSAPPDIVLGASDDVAVISIPWRQRLRDIDGTETDRSAFETDVWFRRGGTWKIVRMHLTLLSK